MKTWAKMLVLPLLVMLLCSLVACKEQRFPRRSGERVFTVLDTLTEKTAHETKLGSSVTVDGISQTDLTEICAAIGRTPSISYEILSITRFPSEIPFVARVEVNGAICVVVNGDNGKWHVFRVIPFHR